MLVWEPHDRMSKRLPMSRVGDTTKYGVWKGPENSATEYPMRFRSLGSVIGIV